MIIKKTAFRVGWVLAAALAAVFAGCTDNKGTGTDTYTLAVGINPPGGGEVELSPSGGSYKAGVDVRVTATPSREYGCAFNAWSGYDDSPDSSITVTTVNGGITLIANFYCTGEPPQGTSFTDGRDGKIYNTVKIGNQTWMAKNLNYQTATTSTDSSWCYENISSNCNTYGRLYNWHAAMKACPSGWKLPDRNDWNILMEAVGGTRVAPLNDWYDYHDAGKRLKSTSGWYNDRNGTDEYEFSALPGGSRDSDGGFDLVGHYGYWWSAAEHESGDAYNRNMYYYYDRAVEGIGGKGVGFSVRCIAR